jgi:hypothetical protein
MQELGIPWIGVVFIYHVRLPFSIELTVAKSLGPPSAKVNWANVDYRITSGKCPKTTVNVDSRKKSGERLL